MTVMEPFEIIQPTPTAVRAAQRTRKAVTAVADGLGARATGTVVLQQLELPVSIVRALAGMVETLSQGYPVAIVLVERKSDEYTTGQAARFLGMSRPTLISLLERGELPFRMVGTHRRLAAADVMAFRARSQRNTGAAPSREERLRGLQEMAETTDRLGLGY